MRILRGFVLLTAWTLPASVLAQNAIITNIDGCDFQTGMLTARCVPLFIAHVISFLFGGIGVFFLINVIQGGYQITMGSIGGNKDAGKDRIRWAIIGFILTACSYLILDLVLELVGAS